MTRVALVVANATDQDPGFVGDRLEEHGYRLRTVLREAGLPCLADLQPPPDLVLLLGSAWSVHDPVEPEALAAEVELVRAARSSAVPVLAICYGAQVVAAALGGHVRPAARPEAGLVEVSTDEPALVPAGPWSSFHMDTLTPPPQAEVVARNACGVQAFLLPGLLGVQFHPEVRPEVLADWASRFPDLVQGAGRRPEEVAADAAAGARASRAAAYVLVDAFLDRVRHGAEASRPQATE